MFLLLLWAWLRLRGASFDLPGGGASASFDVAGDVVRVGAKLPQAGDALGSLGDAGDAAIPLALVAPGGAILFWSVFVIYSAPLLFAELLVDGALAVSLFQAHTLGQVLQHRHDAKSRN